jgi:acetolactate synthase small subunit
MTFTIRAGNSGDVLARVVMLFHRLNIEIAAVEMRRRARTSRMSLKISVLADTDDISRLETQLYKVVHVSSVETAVPKRRGTNRHVQGEMDDGRTAKPKPGPACSTRNANP